MKQVDIEKLVVWAYREELPKEAPPWGSFIERDLSRLDMGSGYGSVTEYGKLLAKVEVPTNQWGVVVDMGAQRDPHADAKAIARAVEALDGLELESPGEDWSPLSDLGDLGEFAYSATRDAIERISILDKDGVRRLRESPRRLVFKHAILGGCPDWECEQPRTRFVSDVRGRPRWFVKRELWSTTVAGLDVCETVEAEGFNETRGKPYPGAYRKTYLEPDPIGAAVARAEYEVWHAALGVLAADLEGELQDFEAMPPARAERPWESAREAPPRILADLTPPKATKPVTRRRRRASALSGC